MSGNDGLYPKPETTEKPKTDPQTGKPILNG